MKNRNEKSRGTEQAELVAGIKAKQRNTVWPDTVNNSRSVEDFLWKGSPEATLVQRVACWMFGLFFILCGISFLDVAYEKHFLLFGALSIGWFFIGGKVFLNGFRKRRSKKPDAD